MPVPVVANPSYETPIISSVVHDGETELEQYVIMLLSSQLKLARSSRSKTTFSLVLKQRLTVLQRILHAFAAKYHIKDKVCLYYFCVVNITIFNLFC